MGGLVGMGCDALMAGLLRAVPTLRRLLQHSVAEAERVAGVPLPAISHFSEEQSSELRDRIFDEFNTLAVILRAPSATFIRDTPSAILEEEPDAPLVRPFYCVHYARLCSSLLCPLPERVQRTLLWIASLRGFQRRPLQHAHLHTQKPAFRLAEAMCPL